jgi:hypothetical protein
MASASHPAVASQAATEAPAPAQPAAVGTPAHPAAAGVKPLAFGAAFEPGPVVSLAALLANPVAYSEQSIITEGHVQRACSRRGCWMEIGEGDAACRVTFKDYGFFVPTDSAGSHARLQGKLSTKEIPAAQVAHLESEGALFPHRRPDGSATEVQLIASAVELTR